MNLTEAQALLSTRLSAIGTPPPDQWQEFLRQFRLRVVGRGETLLSAGEKAESVWFVGTGAVRLYYVRADGKEFNKAFVGSGGFAASLESLLTSEPSRLNVETLTDCRLLQAPYRALTEMYPRDPFWERLGRTLAERLYVKKARREAALLMDSASARYEEFLSEMGDLAEVLPGYHVASYLGITPEALSRIRRARRTLR